MTDLFVNRLDESLKGTDLFLYRLEESLKSFEGEQVELALVANKVVEQYYKPGDDYKKSLWEILQVKNDPNIDDNIDTWVLLCSQVLLLRFFKTVGDKDTMKSVGKEMLKTLEKFEELN